MTHPTELWSATDTAAMLFLTVAAIACTLCLWLIGEWRDTHALYRQERKDRQQAESDNRALRHRERQLVWELAMSNGKALTAEQHLCIDIPREPDLISDEPAWARGPSEDPDVPDDADVPEPTNWPPTVTTAIDCLERDPAPELITAVAS